MQGGFREGGGGVRAMMVLGVGGEKALGLVVPLEGDVLSFSSFTSLTTSSAVAPSPW